MSSVKRASAAGIPRVVALGLSVAAIALTGGCSQDVTRFAFFGDGPLYPPGSKDAYAPPGYEMGSRAGKGVKESSLPPADKLVRTPSEDPPPKHFKTADAGSRYAPSPWSWANAPAPKYSGKPLWTDEGEFPWPDAKPKATPSFQGHYTTRRRDTLAGIASRYKVSLAELKRVNGLSEQTRVKVGTVLAIPAPGAIDVAPPTAPPRVVQVKPVIIPPEPKLASLAPPPPAPRMAMKQSGAVSEPKSEPERTSATTGAKFRWPVLGKVISTFGSQADGTRNEGIKLSVPIGTDVQAAEGGRVHYAGDGLKGYGNLILIRHANGWVSTYAHAGKMLVKVGEEVKRGQVIAKSGNTGPISVPQLGFELRKGSVPVNPLEHLPTK